MQPLSLIDELLADQQSFTAVDRFANFHDASPSALSPARYHELIPLERPKPGEQYAFEVELEKCSGCKACVTACHSLNGLDDNETWREVGLLINVPGKPWKPVPAIQQHVTTACHHCVDPACLNGCPVLAYEKDSVTGIVRHLDDQCIGCQYCVLKCPYDVPKYNPRLGIVRKCDMCSNRLAVGEAPACVQACPSEAIRITNVQTESVTIEFRERNRPFLSGAPAGDYTLPTTRYVSAAGRLAAADASVLRPQPAHWPLVLMLVLSQAAVGVTCAAAVLNANTMLLLVALGLGVASIFVSVFHLGRPRGAWRFFLGLKRSWLSREILVFGIFVPWLAIATATALSARRMAASPSPLNGERAGVRGDDVRQLSAAPEPLFVPTPHPNPLPVEGRGNQRFSAVTAFAALVGLAGVFCSMMIYHDTRRVLWHWRRSAALFFGSTFTLGVAAVLAIDPTNNLSLAAFVAVTVAKLLVELNVVRHVTDRELTSRKKTALLVARGFRKVAFSRLLCAVSGLGAALLLQVGAIPPSSAWLPFVLVFTGELLERLLFFRAVDASKMPGGLAS